MAGFLRLMHFLPLQRQNGYQRLQTQQAGKEKEQSMVKRTSLKHTKDIYILKR